MVQNLVFLHFFQNSPNPPPVKGGLGGSPNDIFDVMQGSIYADILCMALACRIYHDIYNDDDRTTVAEIRHAMSAKQSVGRGAFC